MGNVFIVIQGLDATACQVFDLGLPQRNCLGTRNERIHRMNEHVQAYLTTKPSCLLTAPGLQTSVPPKRGLGFPEPDPPSCKHPPILASQNPCKRDCSLNPLTSNLPWTPYSRSPAVPVFTWTQWFCQLPLRALELGRHFPCHHHKIIVLLQTDAIRTAILILAARSCSSWNRWIGVPSL